MSDFDEEAERERLREKYEKDEERRKETQQMSELLLKGATMTNRHCGECGSPIFRYQGQEFCPSCQRVTGGEEAAAQADADESPTGSASSPEADAPGGSASNGAVDPDSTSEVGSDDADAATVPESTEPEANPEPGLQAGPEPDPHPDPEPAREATAEAGVGVSPKPEATSGRSVDVSEAPAATRDESAASERTAREALLRALTRHARLAEGTDDPRRAKEHLAAAREAAEAVDELE